MSFIRPPDSSSFPEASTPGNTQRYHDTRTCERKHFPLLSKTVSRDIPPGWSKYIHPEGKPYYFHSGDNLLTECNIEAKHILSAVEYWRDRIRTLEKDNGLRIASLSELVLELDFSTKPERCKYYFVSWAEKRVFWYEDVDTEMLGIEMAVSQEHLALALKEEFWTHVEYFPKHRSLPEHVNDDLIATLAHAATDQLTSETSTAPWSASECERFLNLIRNLKSSGEKTCIVARLWRTILHSQFINLYGQPGARLSRTQSVMAEARSSPSHVVASLCSAILFNAPTTYEEALAGLWVDKVVYAEHWSAFMRGMKQEWNAVGIVGMLLLGINVSLLVNHDREDMTGLASVLSTSFALSSSLSSILLIRRHRTAESYNAENTGLYLEQTCHPLWGHWPLAIIFGLPYAFLLWSFFSLVVALAFFVPLPLDFSLGSIAGLSGVSLFGLILYWSVVGFWKGVS